MSGAASAPDAEASGHGSPRRWLPVLGIVAVLALGVGIFWLLRSSAEEGSTEPPELPLVTAVAAETADALVVTQTGFVRPIAQVDVAPEVSGRIAEVAPAFTVGGRVAAGDMLLRLERTRFEADLARARAAVRQAEAALAEARVARDRQEQLESRDFASEAALQQAIVTVAAREADLTAARADLTQAEIALDDTTLTAPFDAIVTAEDAAVGAYLQTGTAVGTLVAAESAEIRLGLTPADLDLLGDPAAAVGATVIVRTTGTAEPVAEGEVTDVVPEIEAETRTVELVVRVPRPFDGEAPLRIDELVELALPVSLRNRPAVAVPAEALKGRAHVFRIEDGTLRRVDVRILQRDETRVVLAGDVLSPGDRVMVSDLSSAFDGRTVRTEDASEEETRTAGGDG